MRRGDRRERGREGEERERRKFVNLNIPNLKKNHGLKMRVLWAKFIFFVFCVKEEKGRKVLYFFKANVLPQRQIQAIRFIR